jgi:hypothetical protein
MVADVHCLLAARDSLVVRARLLVGPPGAQIHQVRVTSAGCAEFLAERRG